MAVITRTSLKIRSLFCRLFIPVLIITSVAGVVRGQQSRIVQSENDTSSIRIIWNGVEEVRITESEVFRRMAFEGAVYPDNPVVPEWHQLFTHKQGITRLKASLEVLEKEIVSSSEANTFGADTDIGIEFIIRVVPVVVRRERFSSVFITPLRKVREGEYERILAFRINIQEEVEPSSPISPYMHRTGKGASLLSSGEWYKIRVNRSGIHRIDYQQLSELGLAGGGSANIRLFGMGGAMLPETAGEYRPDGLQEIAVQVVDGGDNSIDQGDYILFYGEGPGKWFYDSLNSRFTFQPHLYDNYNYYYLTRSNTPGLRVQNQTPPGLPPTNTVVTYQDFFRYENDSLNLIKSGKLWVGEVFDLKTTYNFNFNVPNIDPLTPVEMYTSLVARSLVASNFTIQAGQHTTTAGIPNILPGYNSPYATRGFKTLTFNTSANSIPVAITYNKPLSSSIGWLDYFEFNLRRQLRFSGSQFLFRDYSVSGSVAEYQIAQSSGSTQVWDITNPFAPERVQGTLSGSVYSFGSDVSVKRQFVAVNDQGWYTVETAGKVANQNLRSASQTEMVIISHPDFLQAAERLASIHRNKSGLSVLVVTPGPVYNEFSSGKQDPTAIRDFIKMFYDRASTPKEMPKYLLLFGDGSYDNKNRMPNNTNFIPTFQSEESLNPAGTYVTDDYFGMLDDHEGLNSNGSLDIGVGRMPVATQTEASQMVDKIERYLSDNSMVGEQSICVGSGNTRPLADWRNTICIVADDEDSNLHIDQAEYLTIYCDTNHTVYNINKIYLDAYQQVSISGGHRYPEVNEAINKQMERGALIMNYIGHGGELGWAHERILRIDDIQSWSNNWQMPLFITSTCEFSRFDDPARRSAGEYVYMHPNGGAIALFTTTRLAFASSNYAFNSAFYKQVFNKVSGEYQSIGDIFRFSKILSGSQASNRNIVILGDPALKLVYPKHKVITTHINDSLITSPTDTLKALSKITVKGAVTDRNDQILHDFNGFLYPLVLDKKMTYTTLGQDQGSYSKQFWMQKNALYRGKVTVSKGLFSFTFIVPKDIAYAYGFGKISYYAENGVEDAHGFYDRIVVGGTADGNIADDTGPLIRLYLNDSTFVFGGTTDTDPVILALLSDEHGINTTGSGIGHDIVAVIDGNTNNSIILNDYYEADLDSYNSGRVIYSLSGLEDGPHQLSVKAWDILNNSSEVFTEFIVASADKPILTHVLNWPNPFTTNTEFWFEHNQPCCDLDVMIEVFTISGKIVKTILQTITFTGYRAGPIPWDGLDDYGDRLARGVYIYKVSIRNNEQKRAEKYEKLVILR